MKRQQNWSNIFLWAIYLALLVVLLPHTAWAFGRFESPAVGWMNIQWGTVTAWAAAFAFEAAIAALTHKLAKHIESTPRYTAGRVWLRRISYQYLNAFSAGLLVAVGVSVLPTLVMRSSMVKISPSTVVTMCPLCYIRWHSVAYCLLFRSCSPAYWPTRPRPKSERTAS